MFVFGLPGHGRLRLKVIGHRKGLVDYLRVTGHKGHHYKVDREKRNKLREACSPARNKVKMKQCC